MLGGRPDNDNSVLTHELKAQLPPIDILDDAYHAYRTGSAGKSTEKLTSWRACYSMVPTKVIVLLDEV